MSKIVKATPARILDLQPGDRVLCKPRGCRWNTRWTWRNVIEVKARQWSTATIGVAYPSWGPGTFWIKPSEIKSISTDR